MVKNTNEKAIIKVNNGIFARLRRFILKKFANKNNDMQRGQKREGTVKKLAKNPAENINQIKKEKKLFDYDAPDNENLMINNMLDSKYFEETNNSNQQNKNEKSDVCKEKEELEKKLMNYYQSIKKSINTNNI